jgi:hypothetical protein
MYSKGDLFTYNKNEILVGGSRGREIEIEDTYIIHTDEN